MIETVVADSLVRSRPDFYAVRQSFLEVSLYSPTIPNDPQSYEVLISEALELSGVTLLGSTFGRYAQGTIHGVIHLPDLQLGIHVWPDARQASICFMAFKENTPVERLADVISVAFSPLHSAYIQSPASSQHINISQTENNAPEKVIGDMMFSCNLSTTPVLPSGSTLDWVCEYDNAGEQHQYKVKEIIAFGETEFQHYAVLDTYAFGKVLFLDGYVQSAQQDEHIYHECLIQPAMLAHPDPKKVLVIGAGEGATAREILYHPGVERVVLIDLDEELINVCKQHLDTHHRGAFDHPKVELIFQDGYSFLEQSDERFDVIVIDVVDAIEEGPAQALYTREFYQFLKEKCLTENGIVVVQSMELNDVDLNDDWHVHREMAQSFSHVCSYATFVPSFWSKWRYTISSDTIDFNSISSDMLDASIEERGISDKLNFLTGEIFAGSRALSKQAITTLEQVLENPDGRVAEADISKHFRDWDLNDFIQSTQGKNLDN